MSDNLILALDTATKTGWCLMKDGNVYESGVQDFSKRRGESNGAMFLRFRKWLKNILSENPVTFCIYEQAHHRGGAATEICVNLTGRVQEACAEAGLEYAAVRTGDLKKWACGHGNASKDEMIDRAATLLAREPLDDNEADAVLIGAYAAEIYGG